MRQLLDLSVIEAAAKRIGQAAIPTPLEHNKRLSKLYDANILMKREDLQPVRSFKIRGAYNKISLLNKIAREKGVVCSSAGNHAQGVAYACSQHNIHGTIFMPSPTPQQKVSQVAMFGGDKVTIKLVGDTYDDCYESAKDYVAETGKTFIHPFDDPDVIAGQATMALEILNQAKEPIDYIIVPIGGGGLISGIISVFKQKSPHTKFVGIEPKGAPSMYQSLQYKKRIRLDSIDVFVDGAAVKTIGEYGFDYCMQFLEDLLLVDEGEICQNILNMYTYDAIVVEPAGAMSVSALSQLSVDIKGKNVVCLVCGGNNDITRMAEIKERALLFNNLKHYFIVRFPQRPGALREFVQDILGPTDDITFFEYSKKSIRAQGPAVVGIQIKSVNDFEPLKNRMKEKGFFGDYLNNNPDLFQFLI
ncbi:MAG: threonine ammonia-lyase IlvA [Flavobacteriaceae bacterium]|nr:threonine dehydratase [Flavobacteriaceae bacterium]OUW68959.1 MAG: threonine dehydratase [Candidatus Pelagibacter sp. TMED202]